MEALEVEKKFEWKKKVQKHFRTFVIKVTDGLAAFTFTHAQDSWY